VAGMQFISAVLASSSRNSAWTAVVGRTWEWLCVARALIRQPGSARFYLLL